MIRARGSPGGADARAYSLPVARAHGQRPGRGIEWARLALLALFAWPILAALAQPAGRAEAPPGVEVATPEGPPPGRPPPPAPEQLPPIEEDGAAEPPAPVAPPAAVEPPAGRWVYTVQYGWAWLPYSDAYTYVPAGGQGQPHEFVFLAAGGSGWTWVAAPWIWGLGPWPTLGDRPASFGWYRHGWWRDPDRWRGRLEARRDGPPRPAEQGTGAGAEAGERGSPGRPARPPGGRVMHPR